MGYDDYDDRYDDHYEEQRSGGMSVGVIVAIVLVILVGGCGFMGIVAAIAVPNLLEARKHGNESAAIGGLKTVSMAEALFREGDKDGDGVLDYGTLQELGAQQLVDMVLAQGTKQGYHFQVVPGPDKQFEWWATADPVVPGTTGERFFYTDQTGVVYYSTQPIQGPLDPQALPPTVFVVGR